MRLFDWIAVASILLITFAGAYMPLFKQEKAKKARSFPLGQAFSSGVFLALALFLMLPSAFHLFRHVLPNVDYPVAAIIAIVIFLCLLFLEQYMRHIHEEKGEVDVGDDSPVIPIVMIITIGILSFFMGAAIGVSKIQSATLLLIAILAHKSSAGFALSLKMVQSSMSRNQVFVVFALFACSTPIGILVGDELHKILGMHSMMVIKAIILSIAAGTFLYMGTLHELRHSTLITECRYKKGFLLLVAGIIVTALVRYLIGEAHHV